MARRDEAAVEVKQPAAMPAMNEGATTSGAGARAGAAGDDPAAPRRADAVASAPDATLSPDATGSPDARAAEPGADGTAAAPEMAALAHAPIEPGIIDLSRPSRELRLFIVAGEHSGDALGGRLMAAVNSARRGRVHWLGVGGPAMEAEGLTSQYPLDEVAVMGLGAIVRQLPRLYARVVQTADAAVAANPDAVVIIDSPELTHPIARRIRKRRPDIPIVDYVSPSVWAWRPGRARRMRRYVDHVLALLPFEPAAHARLGGPACTYVGHPLVERLDWLARLDARPLATRLGLDPARPVLVLLPGSRRSEVARLLDSFAGTLEQIARAPGPPPEVLVPTVEGVRGLVEAHAARWSLVPHILAGETDRWRAFKLARAALAASGTVTLELALAGTPMVVAYKVEPLMAPFLRRMIAAPTVVLPNLVLGENAFPELLQEACTPEALAAALIDVMADGPARTRQLAALAEVPARMRLATGTPSGQAASIVLALAERPLAGRQARPR